MSEAGSTGQGGRIIPALRYRNARAAIDWLCKAFGFEAKMVVQGDGDRVALPSLCSATAWSCSATPETEYSIWSGRRFPASPSRKGSMWRSTISTNIMPGLWPKVPRS
jgi:hypothetical protein